MTLRRRCEEQEHQVDRQEQIIIALKERGKGGASSAGVDSLKADPAVSSGGLKILQQQIRLLEVRMF